MMDFFLETGIFIGVSDELDNWHIDCESFFAEHPFQSNDYYTAERVKIELRRNMRERRHNKGSDPVLRSIEQQIKLYLDMMKGIVNYGKHSDYENIHNAVGNVIPKHKEGDITIVTNAMIWSYCGPLTHPTLVTVDFIHMINNRAELKRQVSLAIGGRHIPLEIESPRDLCGHPATFIA
jgi:hypothetical protein